MSNRVKDAIMLCLIGFIFCGSIIYNHYYNDTHRLEIVKEKIVNTSRIVIAISEIEKYDINKDFVYSYVGKKYEVIKKITDKEEIKEITNAILNSEYNENYPKDTNLLTIEKLIQFYDESNKKLAEYDLQSIKSGFGIRSAYITIDEEIHDNILKYYDDYQDKINDYYNS